MPFPPDWILYFGSPACLDGEAAPVRELAERFPAAVCCGCTTAGEILQNRVHDDSVVAALVRFEGTRVRALAQPVASPADSRAAGLAAARQLQADDLRHVLVLSEGLKVNGTALVAGLREGLPENVAVTGGLAGDGARFQRTRVGLGAMLQPDQVVVVGFYGLTAAVSFGSAGGWEAFGPRRRLGSLWPAPAHYALGRQRALRAGWSAGAGPLQALSRRARGGPAGHRVALSFGTDDWPGHVRRLGADHVGRL